MKITKEQIKQAYENPENLKEFFPEAFEVEIKIGNWYKTSWNDNLFYVTSISKDGDLYGYGFYNGVFEDYTDEKGGLCACNSIAKEHVQEATHKEVEEALINEAKKRGFKDGVKVSRDKLKYCTDNIVIPNGCSYFFDFNFNILYLNGKEIFSAGIFAEIIPDTLEVTLDQVAEKFGVQKIKIVK